MFSTSKSLFVAALLSAVIASVSLAQQPQAPSQRFSPERNVPPSVHVPDGATQRIPLQNQKSRPTSYNFADTPSSAFRSPGSAHSNPIRRTTQQVSYNEEIKKQLPEIPAVLRSSNLKSKSQQPAQNQVADLRPPSQNQRSQKTQADNKIKVDKDQFANHNRDLKNRLDQLKRLRSQNTTSNGDGPHTIHNQQVVHQIQSPPPVHQVAFNQDSENSKSAVTTADVKTSELQGNLVQPATTSKTTPNVGIQQVSAESEAIARAAVDLSTPAIRVQSFGPRAIGINKVATYKITVSNDGEEDAEQIQVGIGIPADIDLQNIIVSAGHHEITDGIEQSRLLWTVERIAGNSTHTIALNVIPRTAQPFEMEVNWKFLPLSAITQVQVTEPKLEMKISGPTEVQFGEKAIYDVTVLNPGSGNAERVSVMLPEALGGEKANIGDVNAGGEKRFKVELFARTAGELNLAATAIGDGDISATASHNIVVRRANLQVTVDGPPMKYAGSVGQYTVTIANDGDASATDVAAVLALPSGVKYLGGINNVESSDGGLKWNVGSLTPGDKRLYKVNCQLDASGQLTFQAGARGAGDLASTGDVQTKVDTVADLTLDVEDPKGPLPTGENVNYKIVVRNRGSRSANGVDLVMQFSEGIEPVKADGFKHKIVTGQVIFAPITRIEPGQQVVLNVTAQALKSGTHIFRAQLTCEESDSREIGEGTTRFFGDDVATDVQHLKLPDNSNTANAEDSSEDTTNFK